MFWEGVYDEDKKAKEKTPKLGGEAVLLNPLGVELHALLPQLSKATFVRSRMQSEKDGSIPA